MPVHLSPEQVGLEMLCLCGQLDLLIRAQMQQVDASLASVGADLVVLGSHPGPMFCVLHMVVNI